MSEQFSRRSFLTASAATTGLAAISAGAFAGEDSQAELRKIGKTPKTKFAVNVEMWWSRKRVPFLDRIRNTAALGFPAVELWPWQNKDIPATAKLTKELGYYHDTATGLFLLNQRFYNAVTGRFLSADPIRDDRWNLYRYVGNGVLNAVDPSGWAPLRNCTVNKKADEEGGARTNECPKKWVPPSIIGDLEQYGCYCGREPKPPRKTVPPPNDEVDRCCCVHDNDYDKVDKKKMTRQVADARLCCCIDKAVDELKCTSIACNKAYNKIYVYFKCAVLTKKYDCKKLLSCIDAMNAQHPYV